MKSELLEFLQKASEDTRLQATHINVMTAALCLKEAGDIIQISRKKIMKLSSVRSISTYHKCIAELVSFGYIIYQEARFNYYKR